MLGVTDVCNYVCSAFTTTKNPIHYEVSIGSEYLK